jgi:hypothetical protein
VINALYLWPITLWTYLKYGRPPKPSEEAGPAHKEHSHDHSSNGAPSMAAMHEAHNPEAREPPTQHGGNDMKEHDMKEYEGTHDGHNLSQHNHGIEHTGHEQHHGMDHKTEGHDNTAHHDHMQMIADRPMFATVTIGVCHCGAGCVLGDIVGEWLVYGTNATINGKMFGPECLIGMFYRQSIVPLL